VGNKVLHSYKTVKLQFCVFLFGEVTGGQKILP
jgi:hypothetical protein